MIHLHTTGTLGQPHMSTIPHSGGLGAVSIMAGTGAGIGGIPGVHVSPTVISIMAMKDTLAPATHGFMLGAVTTACVAMPPRG